MKHIILTRIDVPLTKSVYDPSWLWRRCALFERFCLPSMAAQTDRGFEWLVYVRPGSPLLARVEAWAEDVPSIRVVEVATNAEAKEHALSEAKACNGPVMTTRIDADDAVASGFVAHLHCIALAGRAARLVVNFDMGYVLDDVSGALMADTQKANPFTTLIEWFPDRGPVTIWGAKHNELGRLAKTRHVTGRRMWVQVIHGENLVNKVRGVPVQMSAADVARFPAAVSER